MELNRFLRRKAASQYLQDVHGVVRAASTLAKYAVIGGGPVFQRMGRDPVYTPVGLDEWVASKLSGPMRSTSDMLPLQAKHPAVTSNSIRAVKATTAQMDASEALRHEHRQHHAY